MSRWPGLLAALLVLVSGAAAAEPVRVAVAANFLAAAKTIAAEFEQRHGATISLSSGSTGGLYAQIHHGAPYDVFLAADARSPARLEREGLTVPGSRFTYARGRLVLWSRDPALLADGPEALVDGRIARLAIANPKTAPYGAAAVQTLRHLGLWERWQEEAVRGENVGQTLQFALTGNVDAAFVALAQVQHPSRRGSGSLWPVPADHHQPIEQQAVVLRDGAAVQAFAAFLRSDAAGRLIREAGYDVP